MQPPIIIDENGDLSFYRSVEAAAAALEPIDVRNNEYVAYDGAAYLLSMAPSGGRVIIPGRVSEEPCSERLERALRSCIARASGNSAPAEASVSELLSLCIVRFGYEEP